MSAGTVISGGFPGRVAQEVQPNPKCNGCLHYDGQAGRTGACTIGLRPWLCGEGDAADIGYAPLVRGAGTYLPGMSNRSAQAPEVGKFDLPELYGSGSHRPVPFQQVSLGEEHVHFAKSLVSQHTSMQKSMCRLCQSTGMIGMAPANVGPQICTCAPIEARTVAKALVSRLSNLERSVVDLADLTAFVYDAAEADFNPRMMKGAFYHGHGKYEVSPAGGGSHHVDFHPKGGGPAARVGTYGSHREARRASETHARRFAAGTGTEHGGAPMHAEEEKTVSIKKPKSTNTPAGLPSMHGAVSVAKKGDTESDVEKGDRVSFKNEDDSPSVEHPRSWVSHAKVSHGSYMLEEPGIRTGEHARLTYHGPNGTGHITTHSSTKEAKSFAKQHHAEKTGQPSKGRQAGATYVHHFGKSGSIGKAEGTMPPKVEREMPRISYRTGQPASTAASKPKHIQMPAMDVSSPKVTKEPKVNVESVQRTPSTSPSGKPIAGGYKPMSQTNPKTEASTPRVSYKSVDETVDAITKAVDEIAKAIDDTKHSHIVTGKLAPNGRGASSRVSASRMVDKLDNKYGGYGHSVKPNPNFKPPTAPHGDGGVEKSLDDLLTELHNEEDVEKSLRWSHTKQGNASTSHGKYTVHPHQDGGHTVTYTSKETGKSHAKTFASHREALGAVTEHHLKNRPPPKPRKKKDPNAPKAPKAAGGPCPPCP